MSDTIDAEMKRGGGRNRRGNYHVDKQNAAAEWLTNIAAYSKITGLKSRFPPPPQKGYRKF
jgi:hypothetical protein